GKVSELGDDGVSRSGVGGDAKLPAVVVGEPDAELPARGHGLDPREEQVVVAEAEVGGEDRVEAAHALVEALGEQVELFGLGAASRLVDLDPFGPQRDQGLQVRPDDVASDVEDEAASRLVSPVL